MIKESQDEEGPGFAHGNVPGDLQDYGFCAVAGRQVRVYGIQIEESCEKNKGTDCEVLLKSLCG